MFVVAVVTLRWSDWDGTLTTLSVSSIV